MYLHLGQGVVVPYRDVLALFDLDNTSASHLTRRFLERAEQAGQVVNVAEDSAQVVCPLPPGGRGGHRLSLPVVHRHAAPAGGEQQLRINNPNGPPEAAPAAGPQGRPLAARISQWRFSNV